MKPIILPKIFQPFYCKDLIRLGKDNDGGYLVNKKDIIKSKKLIGLGIRDDWSFEQDFTKIHDCPVAAYDGEDLQENKISLKSFFRKDKVFINKNIGNKENEIKFPSIVEKGCFLKCDIEGSEYDILDDIIRYTKYFTGIVIEFHEIQNYGNFNSLTNFMSKIDQKLVHVHVNNWDFFIRDQSYVPQVIELTFSSSSNIELKEVKLPHKLDMPNCSDRDDFTIIF